MEKEGLSAHINCFDQSCDLLVWQCAQCVIESVDFLVHLRGGIEGFKS